MTDDFVRFRELLNSRKYPEALRIAEQQLLAEEDPFWLTQQARVLCRQKKYTPALQAAERALALQPGNSYAILSVADAYFGLNHFSEALEYYREVINATGVQVAAAKKVLECHSHLKQWQKILELATRQQLPPELFRPYQVKALTGLGRVEEALAVCREWVKAQPDDPQAIRALIGLEVKLQGAEVVLSNLARMIRIPSLAPTYREEYITLCEKNGRSEEARREMQSLQAGSSDPWVQRRNAFHRAKNGGESEALPLLEEFMRDDPEDKYLHASYLAACGRIGALGRARDFYRELRTLHPEAKSLFGRIKKLNTKLEASSQPGDPEIQH